MSYDNDYIILVDENGQPYIAHSAIGNKIKDWTNHKYIAKEPDPKTGKMLYFYNQHDYDVWKQGGKRTLRNRIQDKLGFDERSARDDAEDYFRRAEKLTPRNEKERQAKYEASQNRKKAYEAYGNTALGRLEKLTSAAKVKGTNLKNAAGKTLGEIRNRAGKVDVGKWLDDHDGGLTEAARYYRNRDKVDENSAYGQRLKDDYNNTAAGKLDRKIRGGLESAREKLRRGNNEPEEEYEPDNIVKRASDSIKNASSSLKDAATKYAGTKERNVWQSKMDEYHKYMERDAADRDPQVEETLYRNMKLAERDYTNTPFGKVEKAEQQAKVAFDSKKYNVKKLSENQFNKLRNDIANGYNASKEELASYWNYIFGGNK